MWNKLIAYLSKNSKVTNVFIILLLITGLICGSLLRRDISPYVEPRYIHVRIYLPGSSAQELEQDVIIPLEKTIQQLDFPIEYTAFANDNFGQIRAVFSDTPKMSKMKSQFIRRLQNVPIHKDAKLIFSEEGAQSIPMFSFAIYKTDDSISDKSFYQFTKTILDKMRNMDGVGRIEEYGLCKDEIHIDVNPQSMEKKYVSLYEMIQSIRMRNIYSSSGFIKNGKETKQIVTDGRYSNILDIKDTIIRSSFEKKRIRIKDVANVRESLEDKDINININGGTGVVFGLVMQANEDIKKVTHIIENGIEEYRKILPKGIDLVVIDKRFYAVDIILNLTQVSVLIGMITVFLVLILFLDWRTSFWTSLGIPITLSILFIFMYFTDMSMDVISLCGIMTVLGMLVDHGIVISENIYYHRTLEPDIMKAVIKGTKEVFVPVLVTVITTIVAFIPLTMISGTIGGLIRPVPIVVCVCLIISFFEAMVFLPAHISHIPISLINSEKQEKKWIVSLRNSYTSILQDVLDNRYIVLFLFFLILMSTIFLVRKMFDDFIFIEPIGTSSIFVNMEAEGDISFEYMKTLVKDMESLVKSELLPSEYTAIKAETGRFDILSLWSLGSQSNRGQVAIYLKHNYIEGRTPDQILSAIKRKIAQNPIHQKFTHLFFESSGLIPKGKQAIVLQFLQMSQNKEKDYIEMMKEIYEHMNTIPGLINLRHTPISGKDKLFVSFDYEKTAQLGIDVHTVAETLKIATGGLVVSEWKSDHVRIPYLLRIDPEFNHSLQIVQNLLIPNRFYQLIRLKEFSEFSEREGVPDLLRSQGFKMVQISADVDPEITTSKKVFDQINLLYNDIKSKYKNAKMLVDGEASDILKSFEDFKIAFILAISLIYIILLSLFKSILQPFIVLITIPFGMIGAIWAFYLHGQVLSFMSIVGIIGLMGVVVNDAIVMVDFINSVVRKGGLEQDIKNKIVEGAQKRFKAVLLTTVTTVSGLFPSIYGLKGVADLIVPIATAMAYGLIFATILTLLLLPVIYLIWVDIAMFLKKKTEKNKEKSLSSMD